MAKSPTQTLSGGRRDRNVDQIIADLRFEGKGDVVSIFVPSHDKTGKRLDGRANWAEQAMQLFGELYGGATAFNTHCGIYVADDGRQHWDEPVIVEAFAKREHIEDEDRLKRLLEFAKRLKKQTQQVCVMIVFNDVARFI